MIKLVPVFILSLLGCAIVAAAAWFRLQNHGVQKGQAGVAYVQNEKGEFVELTGERPATRILPADLEAQAKLGPTSEGAAAKSAGKEKAKGDGADEEWLTKFTLTERSGKRMGSAELKGQPYVAGFFFTSCPSICPKQNEKVRQLQEKFKGKAVRFVSISCDPEVDRPEVLAAYADRFSADKDQWLFFTGDFNYIRRVGAEYFGLGITRYAHPEKFAVMDADGKLFGYYAWNDANQWQALQADLEKMIAAPAQ